MIIFLLNNILFMNIKYTIRLYFLVFYQKNNKNEI